MKTGHCKTLSCFASTILTIVLAGISPNLRGASISSPALVDDGTTFRTNQNLDTMGALDWEIYESTTLAPSNRRNSPQDRLTLSANLDSATLSTNLDRVGTSFDYSTGVQPASATGDDPSDLRMLSPNFGDDFYTLTFTTATATPHTVTVWGIRRYCDVQVTASLPNTSDVVSSLTGGGSSTETAWFYQVSFVPDEAGDVFEIEVRGLAVGGTANERLGINAAAIEGQAPAQNLVADSIFQDNMVLQRDMRTPVWGVAVPGTTVTLDLDGTTVGSAVADGNGDWLARIDPQPHDGGISHTLEISAPGETTIAFANVVFGDVYLASGQSNMFRVVNGNNVLNADAEVAAADYPLIRQLEIGATSSPFPLEDPQINEGWTPCSPSAVGNFSATGYFFARDVHLATGVPVGLLFAARGARRIEHFLAPEGLAVIPELAGLRQELEESPDANYFDLYNGMIAPLVPYGLRGAIWYQGEWDASSSDETDQRNYHQKMRALIGGWRQIWDQGDFPFYFVQLPNFGDDRYPLIREAQLFSLTENNVGMAVTIESADDNDLHPKNKQDVGFRLAQWALAEVHGQDIVKSGPILRSASVEGGSIRVTFDHVGEGLIVGVTNGLLAPVVEVVDPLENFEIAGADRVFVDADAVIDGDTVMVSSSLIPEPVYVRYCFEAIPGGATSTYLYNSAGLPASPFRTDVEHGLSVAVGTGDGYYPEGTVVAISAEPAPSGTVFDRWIGLASGIADPNAASTTITMPTHGVHLLATYRNIGAAASTVTVDHGAGNGTSQQGSYISVAADPPAAGLVFDRWIGDIGLLEDPSASLTTLTMPESDVNLEATYRMLYTAGDGIPDLWRAFHFPPGDGSTPTQFSISTADPDGDGRDNGKEFIEGSNPNIADFGPQLQIQYGEDGVRIQFAAKAAEGPGYYRLTRWFDLQHASSLFPESWSALPGYSGIQGEDQDVTHTEADPPPRAFYRIQTGLQ